MRQVEVKWSRGYDFRTLDQKAGSELKWAYGLYMFLETLTTPAAKSLIYIGLIKSDYRDYRTRMQDHRKNWLGRIEQGQVYVKFGHLYTMEKPSGRLIEDTESVLILANQPRENTAKMSSFTFYDDLVVTNTNVSKNHLKKRSSTKDFDVRVMS